MNHSALEELQAVLNDLADLLERYPLTIEQFDQMIADLGAE